MFGWLDVCSVGYAFVERLGWDVRFGANVCNHCCFPEHRMSSNVAERAGKRVTGLLTNRKQPAGIMAVIMTTLSIMATNHYQL